MSGVVANRLTRRLGVLCILLIGLLALSSGPAVSDVHADVCCSSCDETYGQCQLNCEYNPRGGTIGLCFDLCFDEYTFCFNHCDEGC
jgi:hypothetical protein